MNNPVMIPHLTYYISYQVSTLNILVRSVPVITKNNLDTYFIDL